MPSSADLIQHFKEVTDPRRGEPVYPLTNILTNILFMSVCAVIAGVDDFVAIAKYARTKKTWFKKFLDLSAGIPSHDRFNAILASLKPAEFEKALLQWITSLQEITAGQIVAMDGKTDGKTLRRSYDRRSSKSAIHMVSAWATAMRKLCLKSRVSRSFTPTTTKSDPSKRPAPNQLDRNFTAEAPNRKWVTDITFLPTAHGWVYLAVVLDLFGRKVVGWSIGTSLATELVSDALRCAIENRRPDGKKLLHHSDRGCQHTSNAYQQTL